MRTNKGTFFMISLSVILGVAIIVGYFIPQWLLNAQVNHSLDQTHAAEALYQNFTFAQADEATEQWVQLSPDTDQQKIIAEAAGQTLYQLMQAHVLPTFLSNELFCLAVYQNENQRQSLWKATFYVPSTNCVIRYHWDDIGIKKIELQCDICDTLTLPIPIEAVSAFLGVATMDNNDSSAVFSLCSDTAFAQYNEGKETYYIRSRIRQEKLLYTLMRVNQ